VREGTKEYAHKRGHAATKGPQQMLSTAVHVPPFSLFLHRYHRSTACPLIAHLTQTKRPLSSRLLARSLPYSAGSSPRTTSLQGPLLRRSLPWQPHKFWNFAARGQILTWDLLVLAFPCPPRRLPAGSEAGPAGFASRSPAAGQSTRTTTLPKQLRAVTQSWPEGT